jgi:hypothetical protein
VLLQTAGILYVGATLVFGFIANYMDPSPTPSAYLFLAFTALSGAIFIGASIGIRRCSYGWTLTAVVTTLINIAAMLSCFGFTLLHLNYHDSGAPIICCIAFLPLALLIPLAYFLLTFLRQLKQPH